MASGKTLVSLVAILVLLTGGAGYIAGLQANPTLSETRTSILTMTLVQTSTLVSGSQTFTTFLTSTLQAPDLIQLCFSPGGNCDQVVVSWVERANVSLHILIYSFTLDNVRNALIAAHDRGVDVKVVMEKDNVNGSGSEYYNLKAAGIPIEWDSRSALLHDKYMVVDGKFVLTGSFNWSTAATEENDENLVAISSTAWAQAFDANFQQVYSVSIPG